MRSYGVRKFLGLLTSLGVKIIVRLANFSIVFFEFAKESSKMASNKRDLKIISIAQLVMAGILFVLGMVDHFEVRYMYASLILMPIWIALLVSI